MRVIIITRCARVSGVLHIKTYKDYIRFLVIDIRVSIAFAYSEGFLLRLGY
jgi:hypothetical protein